MDLSLVGYSGFVGSNLTEQVDFKHKYNSKNIEEAFGVLHDVVVYSGVRAEKYIANTNPEEDLLHIELAIENIKKMKLKKLVLISTVDVYANPVNVNESTPIDVNGLQAYGKNRYLLEEWVKENIDDYHIIRLPGLYGKNLKKNYIYDIIKIIPSMLKEEKIQELAKKTPFDIFKYYNRQKSGFYKLSEAASLNSIHELKEFFSCCGFNALSFTDSRSIFQFYNLKKLWEHILMAIDSEIRLLCLVTEPVSAGELHHRIFGREFINEFMEKPPCYDVKTIYGDLFGEKRGYLAEKDEVLKTISEFVGGR